VKLTREDLMLVLQFVQASAVVIAAFFVARFALRNHRRQKFIDKRVDWFEAIHDAIESCHDAFDAAGKSTDTADAKAVAMASAQDLQRVALKANLYGTHRSAKELVEMNRYINRLGLFDEDDLEKWRANCANVADLMSDAAIAISQEFRRELGAKAWPDDPSLKIRKWRRDQGLSTMPRRTFIDGVEVDDNGYPIAQKSKPPNGRS